MYISIFQAIDVWEHLTNALNKKASHGDTAEIYAYRLMPYEPKYTQSDKPSSTHCFNAANALFNLIIIFMDKHPNIKVFIDDKDYREWYCQIGSDFSHRVKVRIEKI